MKPLLDTLMQISTLALGLGLALHAGAQPAKLDAIEFPYELVPRDAIRGHLMEGEFREPSGAAFDPTARELFVADTKNALIGVFDEDGLPVFAFGGPALLADPKQVVVERDGTIDVLDGEHTSIKVFNYRGELKATLHFSYKSDDGEAQVPVRINAFAKDAQGNWFLGDIDRPQLLIFDENSKLKTAIRPENGGAQFQTITGVAVSKDGLIAVIDYRATPVQIFGSDGRFVSGFGKRDIAREDFSAPTSVRFDDEGYVWVVDMLRHDVKIFDVHGRFQGLFGGWFSPESGGRAPGEMLYPCDLALAPGDGPVYVVERFGQRVQIFNRVKKSDLPADGSRPLPLPKIR